MYKSIPWIFSLTSNTWDNGTLYVDSVIQLTSLLLIQQNMEVLRTLYESPLDVELVVAGSLEHNVPGAQAGPTFLCIITEQFYRTRVGDRYFFENGADPDVAFTPSKFNLVRLKFINP